jgi:hypothetical protein
MAHRTKQQVQTDQATGQLERRHFALQELRVEGAGKQRKIIGYAAVFGALSGDLGGFVEKIQQGAFAKTIGEADIRALFNHDANYVLGRSRAGTLRLWEDARGLGIEILVPDTQWARDLIVTMERGDVDQMSFSFRVVRDAWAHTAEQSIRTLIEVELRDISPVTFPAYVQTIAQARSVFGVEMPELADALCQLERGELCDTERRMLGQVMQRVESRLSASGGRAGELPRSRAHYSLELARRKLQLLDLEMPPPSDQRMRSELEQRRHALDLAERGNEDVLVWEARRVDADLPDDEPDVTRSRRGPR